MLQNMSFSSFIIIKQNKAKQSKTKQKQNKKQTNKQTKTGEILVFKTFLAKSSILASISPKIGKLGKIGNYDVVVTSDTGCLYFYGYVWK